MTDPLEQLIDITAMIAEARDAVYDGKNIDMTEVQGLVKEVCEAIQKNSPADGGDVHDKILTMITNLNLLAEELKNQQKQAGADVIRHAIRKGYTKDRNDA